MRGFMISLSEKKSAAEFSRGFTLLEVAIVLVIIGLLTAPLMMLYKNYMEQQILLKTTSSLAESNNAMQRFFLRNKFYPCPAGRALSPADPNFGRSDCSLSLAAGACSAAGICRVAGETAGETVLIGALPFVTMEMQLKDTADGYANRIQYAITASLANIPSVPPAPPTPPPANPAAREVAVLDSISGVNRTIPGLLVALGSNKLGAYSGNGALITSCAGPGIDVENCDLDNDFIENADYSNASGSSEFDDNITTTDWTLGEIWEYTPSSFNDIYNRNPGNVGIGTDAPTVKLDVVGKIRANDIHAQRLCDETGTVCFSPDWIGGIPQKSGGTALDCGDEVMTGIDGPNGQALCSGVAITGLANQTCAAGEFVSGFDINGDIICVAP